MSTSTLTRAPSNGAARLGWAVRDTLTIARRSYSQLRTAAGRTGRVPGLPDHHDRAVRVRFRQRDQAARRRRLSGVPDARHLHADDGADRGAGGDTANTDMTQGIIDRFKSMPIARGRGAHRYRSSRSISLRALGLACMVACALFADDVAAARRRRPATVAASAAAAVRIGDDVGRHVHRPVGVQPDGRRPGHIRLAVPDDVPGQHVRADAGPAELAAPGRRLEPDERDGRLDAAPVR